jgi:hypothetical protein
MFCLHKGGNPSPGSPRDTLLRLIPNQWCYLRHRPLRASVTSGTPIFHELTGGEYKTQEHIHRDMSDSRLLAIPAS